MTGDEKWVHSDNPKHRKSWGMPGHESTSMVRPNINGAKVMLCIWWEKLGVVYYELLKLSETITEDRYRTELMCLSRELKEKRSQCKERHAKVILEHDSAWSHIIRPVKTYLETLKWVVLPHSPYTRDVAPFDYRLFRSMARGLTHQHFRSYEEVKKWIESWIAPKYASFIQDGIRKLPGIWKKLVANDRQYFES